MSEQIKNHRKEYLDVLRIVAIFLVLFTHTGINGSKLYTISEGKFQIVYIYLDCFKTINNPLLFMISGALLLGKDEDIRTIWNKRVLRFIVVLITFSYIQMIYNCAILKNFNNFSIGGTFNKILAEPIRPQYWYLYTYISFLMMLPFLRKLAKGIDRQQFVYLLVLASVIQDIFPLLSLKLGIQGINFNIFLNSVNTLYPLLGYYISQCSDGLIMKKRTYILLFIISCLGITIAVKMTLWHHEKFNEWAEWYITLFSSWMAVTVFIFVKMITESLTACKRLTKKGISIINFISKTTFGIYLTENVLESITQPIFNILNEILPTLIACLLWLIATMIVGSIIIGILKKIPIIKKLL